MMSEQTKLINILKYAIEQEEKDILFYQEWAHKCNKISVRKLFESLAVFESNHVQELKKVLAKEYERPATQLETIGHLEDYVINAKEKIISDDDNSTLAQVFRVVIKKEKQAFRLYTDMARESSNPEIAAIFRSLAQDEAIHKMQLEREYKTLTNKQTS